MIRSMVLMAIAAAGCYSGPEVVDGSLRGSYLLVDPEADDAPVAGVEAYDQDALLGTSDEEGLLDVAVQGSWLEGLELASFTLRDPEGRYADQAVFMTSVSDDVRNRLPLSACTPDLCP